MQGMIGYYVQVFEMMKFFEMCIECEDMCVFVGCIELLQKDEIQMMEEWLCGNGQDVFECGMYVYYGYMMLGMFIGEQMVEFEVVDKGEFDKFFFEYMIVYYQGVFIMVDDLMEQFGVVQELMIFGFIVDIVVDQSVEIDCMVNMLVQFLSDL